MSSGVDLHPINFIRSLADARDFEKTAFADIEQYIEKEDADFVNAKVAAYWLEGDHEPDARYICVLFLVPYYGGGISISGYGMYIAMPQRLFGAQIDEYVFAGRQSLQKNEDAYRAGGSSTASRFYDIVMMYHGSVSQVFAFDDSETQYKQTYAPSGTVLVARRS